MTIDPIHLLLCNFSPYPYRIGQLIENLYRRIPIDASVCDADALLETRWSFWRNLLISFVDVRLNHHAHDGFLTFAELISYCLRNLGLIVMVLLRVA